MITSAALIMIFVFGAFVANFQPEVKMFGLGLAFAVLVDATIVRMVLVPSIMEILGDANWWFPRRLDRLLPRLDLEGDASRLLARLRTTQSRSSSTFSLGRQMSARSPRNTTGRSISSGCSRSSVTTCSLVR